MKAPDIAGMDAALKVKPCLSSANSKNKINTMLNLNPKTAAL